VRRYHTSFSFYLFSRQNHETKRDQATLEASMGKEIVQQSLQRLVDGKGVPFVISRSEEIVIGIVHNVTMSLNDKKWRHKKVVSSLLRSDFARLDLLRGTR
jgi:hypothetical protein